MLHQKDARADFRKRVERLEGREQGKVLAMHKALDEARDTLRLFKKHGRPGGVERVFDDIQEAHRTVNAVTAPGHVADGSYRLLRIHIDLVSLLIG